MNKTQTFKAIQAAFAGGPDFEAILCYEYVMARKAELLGNKSPLILNTPNLVLPCLEGGIRYTNQTRIFFGYH